jgi:glycosyltransferase involved in cell wall biosynthesis
MKKKKLIKLSQNLFIYQPIVFLHDYLASHVPAATKLNRKILSYQLSKIIDELGLRKDNLVGWISHPIQEEYLGLINEKISIYDCFDDYYAYGGNSFVRKDALVLSETRILRKVDIVFVVSKELYEKKSMINKRTYVIPNAVDSELFGKASDELTSVPSKLLNIRHPIIGMVGNLHQRIDFELIRSIAAGHLGWSFVIVGDWVGANPNFINSDLIKQLKKKTNVHWMGPQPLEMLPNYLKAFDVCLIPYAEDNPLNISCSPLKLYEYLATGKPIVSTNLPSVQEFSGVIHIGNNHEEIEKGIMLALEEKGELQERRRRMAKDNSWDNRAKRIFSIIDQDQN